MQGNTRGRAGVLAMMAAALGLSMGGGAAETRTLHIPRESGYPAPIPDAPSWRFRGRGHRNPTPHRGTSRRANRAAKRRKLRARSR